MEDAHLVAPQVKLVIKQGAGPPAFDGLDYSASCFPFDQALAAHLVTHDVISFLSFRRRKS